VHEVGHPPGKLPKLVVEGLDLAGTHAQRRVAVLTDLRQGELAPDDALSVLALLDSDSMVVPFMVVVMTIVIVTVVVVVAHGGKCRR
jgi:hypothetical protein